MFTQSLVSHAYLSSPDCSSLALRSYWPFHAAALRLCRSRSLPHPSSVVPAALAYRKTTGPPWGMLPNTKASWIRSAKSSACPAPPFTSRVSHIVASSCIIVSVPPSATRPRGHCFSSPFPLRCVIFLALVDRHFREQLLPCQGCAGFVGGAGEQRNAPFSDDIDC